MATKTDANSCTHTPQHGNRAVGKGEWGEKRQKQTQKQICLYAWAGKYISRKFIHLFPAKFQTQLYNLSSSFRAVKFLLLAYFWKNFW